MKMAVGDSRFAIDDTGGALALLLVRNNLYALRQL